MTRPARMLAVVGGLGLLAVVVLGGMARRYESILDRGDAPLTRSTAGSYQERRVDHFVQVRTAVGRALEDAADEEGEALLARLRLARDSALTRVGLSRRAYLEVRSDWQRWRREPRDVPSVTARAFEARRHELEAVDLGDY